ncbi:MAG: hypothetical protein JNL09_06680 [Anaerolineales bacterium]|nr:hypothetical protein [Anaerolineales bacterium]
MTDSLVFKEHPSCLVCQRPHAVQVTVDTHGNRLTCVLVDSAAARILPMPDQLLVVCTAHAGVDVAAALAAYFSKGDDHDHDHDHEGHDHHGPHHH